MILALQRREEVAAMRWSELADDLSAWVLPGSRMKNGRPRDLHLSEAARAVLRGIPRVEGCDFVFSTGRRRGPVKDGPAPISGFSQGKRYLDAAIAKVRAEAAGKTGKAAAVEPRRAHSRAAH